jgi:hypothetical protein
MVLSNFVLGPSEYAGRPVEAPWRWLIQDDSLLHVTVLGNLIVQDARGRVWLLDSWAGRLEGMSSTVEEFWEQLKNSPEFFRSWFLVDFVERLVAAGLIRQPGQVFAPFVSPGLGGSLTPQNFSLAPVFAYVASSSAEAKRIRGRSEV